MQIRRTAAALTSAAALTVSGVAMATPASAATLIDVTIVDVLNDNTVIVQLPLAVAANVCDIDVNVLAAQAEGGDTTCTARGNSRARA